MKTNLSLLIQESLIFAIAFAALDSARIESLPDCGPLPSKWYSGYYNATATKQLHYVFVESLNDPTKDPLLIWFTGGPGCSSFQGLFSENGPFVFEDGESILKPNPHPWNKKANVLYIESPAGVGYSYAATEEAKKHNDLSTTIDAFTVIQQFFQDYIEYQANDLFITGSSYGGIYVPYMAWYIHQYNLQAKMDKNNNTTMYNLKGFLVGNGATNWEYDSYPTMPITMYKFNLISEEIYNNITNNNCTVYFTDVKQLNLTKTCQDAWIVLYNQTIGSRIDVYDLFKKPTGKLTPFSQQTSNQQNRLGEALVNGQKKQYKRGFTMNEFTRFARHPYWLKNEEPVQHFPMSDYLNRQDVRKAFHIPDYLPAFEICNDKITYKLFNEASEWIYPILNAYGYRMIHYSGNTDSMISTLGTQKWIQNLDFKITQNWTQWKVEEQFVGNYIQMENFTFATVHGAGHGAGSIKRKEVQQLILNFIENQPIG